jgi:hypothetical protein
MRRRPPSQNNGGFNNQHRRPRHSGGGSGGGHHQGGGNRPRKNYSAMREKYLAQARDALSSGDRVLAENYFQHADHCYRMMVEEGYNPRAQQQQTTGEQNPNAPASVESEEMIPANSNALPAFITAVGHAGHEPMEQVMAKEPVIVQNWEEN